MKTVFFFIYLGSSSASADYPFPPLSFWSHYLLIALHLQPSHRGLSSHQDSQAKQGKDRSAWGEETWRKAWPWRKGCWGPVSVTASLSHGHDQSLVFLQKHNEPSQVSPTEGVGARVGGSIFDRRVFAAKCNVIHVAYPEGVCKPELN